MNTRFLPVFVLATAIVCMQSQVGRSEVVGAKEMVEQAHHTVPPLANIHALVYQVIDLIINNKPLCYQFLKSAHLTRDGLTVYSKKATLTRCKKTVAEGYAGNVPKCKNWCTFLSAK